MNFITEGLRCADGRTVRHNIPISRFLSCFYHFVPTFFLPMSPTILRAEHLAKSYRMANGSSAPVLRDVSMHVQRSEIVAIVGASGAGKSTLLHLLSALDTPDGGEVTFTPTDTITHQFSRMQTDALADVRNKHIGFIFQFHHLLPEFTALENVMMPALIAGVQQKTSQEQALRLLDAVGLAGRLHHKPDALSGGEQQRVAFARALVNSPALVFADEPTGNLDHANSERLFALMRQFCISQRQTFVIVTHSADIAASADRVLTLYEGVLVGVENGNTSTQP
jgi:lipoprotein-releasing system ATP-binding protein